jgi:hypothetical protein
LSAGTSTAASLAQSLSLAARRESLRAAFILLLILNVRFLQDIRDLDAMYYKKYLPFVRQLSSASYILTSKPYSDPAFKPIYNRELRIYKYDDVLPRAAVYYRADVEHDEGDVLKKLADPAFDIFQTVVLDRTKIKSFQLPRVAEVNAGAARRVAIADIASYSPQAVEIHAELDQSGILALNDSDYPDWAVEIDGNPGRRFTANYLFRGVMPGKGPHVVRFVYRPTKTHVER